MEIQILRRQGKGILEIMAQLSIFFQERHRDDLLSNIGRERLRSLQDTHIIGRILKISLDKFHDYNIQTNVQ